AMVAVLPVAAVLPFALIGARQRDGTVGWRPAGPLLAGLALASLLLLLFSVVWAASRDSGLEGLVRNSLIPGLKAIDPSQSSDERAEVAGRLAALFPAMLLCGWQMTSAANALLAQWGVKLLGWNLRPSPDYRRADLPDWMLAVLAAAAMLGWLVEGEAGYLARNVTVSLLMPYMFVGLAGIHDLMQRAGKPHFGLAIFYVVFMLALPWVIVALMGAGLARQWVRLRRRRSGRSGQEEDDGSDPA
ncbi:MAG: DUF2232 domain-containing protein, partial [Rhodospirillales bacterium]|nr:DUF2232 domain-containing protein [Rhodospirillales bacterium]